ncbi:MAG: hypothetical protein K9K38_16925 [Rhodoferax sp.]|nr:hypothetical protein [Rhodoferax sp.]
MNVNKLAARGLLTVAMLCSAAASVAVSNLDAHGQSKVSNAMAKKWSSSDTSKDGYNAQQDKRVVNIGSKKGGDCVVNVGTVQKGQKAPKDVVVTTKEVINVCK